MFYAMGRNVFFTVGKMNAARGPSTKACHGRGRSWCDSYRPGAWLHSAEVIGYDDYVKAGYEEKNAKAAGTFRLESKEYIVQDGDIMHIRASV